VEEAVSVSEEIKKIDLQDEFRVCPQCGYELGFHCSFLQGKAGIRIILICPDCGARYDVGWKL
jgi:transcription elongation factor Elf1